MAGCDFQAVPGGRAERRASAARPSHRLLEDTTMYTPRQPHRRNPTESSRQRLKEEEPLPPLAAAESE